jgi:branched-chain amino acid transport system substrate-binding protein
VKPSIRLVLLFLGLGLLLACNPAPPRPVVRATASPAPMPPLRLGAILNLANDAGSDGVGRYEAARLAVEVVNRQGGVLLANGTRRPLDLVVYDDSGDPDTATAALQRLAGDGVLAIIGPSDVASSVSARRAAEAGGLPLVSLADPDPGDSTAWRWTFSVAVPPEDAIGAMIDFFSASGVGQMGWLAPRTMAASSLRRELLRQAGAAHIQVIGEEQYAPGAEEFGQPLTRLQSAGPNVILAWPRDSHEAAAIARDAGKIQGLLPVFLGPAASGPGTLPQVGDSPTTVRTLTLRLGVADDLWDHDPLTPIVRDFRREIQAQTGRPPTQEAAGAWDAVRLLVATLERAEPTRAALRDGLEATTDYLGASGSISFGPRRHDGLDRSAYVVARSDDRRWRLPP